MNRQSQRCSVCCDRAYYVFYGAVACDSCRTFFRRQVLHSKDLNCHFKNSCLIQQNTRKDCARCRLDKCLAVGMKKSLVAVGESESSTRSTCCRNSMTFKHPAADDGRLHRSESVCDMPHVPASNLSQESETRVYEVRGRMNKSFEAKRSSPNILNSSRSGSDEDVVELAYSSPSETESMRQREAYYCQQRQGVAKSHFSGIPRSVSTPFRSPDALFGGQVTSSGTSKLSLRQDASPPLQKHKQAAYLTFNHYDHRETNAVSSQGVSRLPILERRLTQSRQHPKIAYKKEHKEAADHSRARELVERSDMSECYRTLNEPSRDVPPADPAREAAPPGARKQFHPKFRKSPPLSLTISMGSDPERAQVIEVTGLSSTQRVRFTEIMNATRSIETGIGSSFKEQIDEIRQQEREPSFVPLLILVCAKTLLSIAGKLAVFDLLPREDKEMLLKGSLTEILFLRSAKHFNWNNQCWNFGSGTSKAIIPPIVPVKVLKAAGDDVYEKYSRFVSTFDPAIFDDVICNLMCAICFFTERTEPLIKKNHIRYERTLYLSLLKSYLDAKYSSDSKLSPADVFSRIQSKLDELASMKEIYEKSNVDLGNIDQLVVSYQQMSLESPPSPEDESSCHKDSRGKQILGHIVVREANSSQVKQ